MSEQQFILSCESTVDLPYAYVTGRDIPILFYSYMIDGITYIDDMGRDPDSIPAFYQRLDAGALPTTSQINQEQYEEFLEPLLQRGDVLHIAFGTGMTNSFQNALLAAETLRERYPDRKLVLIDSLCSSSGYGMLVDDAADMRLDDRGRIIAYDSDASSPHTPVRAPSLPSSLAIPALRKKAGTSDK